MSPAARALAATPPGRCLWGIGHPPDETFRFCGKPAQPGGPYCAVHAERSRNHHDQPPGIVEAIERTGMLGRRGRPSNAVMPRPVPTTAEVRDAHQRAAQRFPDAAE
jgi:hypothetical protein